MRVHMRSLVEVTGRRLWREHDRARRSVDENGRAVMLYYAMLCYDMHIAPFVYTLKIS